MTTPSDFLQDALGIWRAGGWAMYPMAFNALLLYGKCIETGLLLGSRNRDARRWKEKAKFKPGTADKGGVQVVLARKFLRSRNISVPITDDLETIQAAFARLHAAEFPPIAREMRFIKVAMSAAPLWGLLGTVTGMLLTFVGLASGGGGEQTMDVIASGISEALITTETGLMVAIPGYFLHYYLCGQRDRYRAFISNLETTTTQYLLAGRATRDAA